jgi:hypothetical protein
MNGAVNPAAAASALFCKNRRLDKGIRGRPPPYTPPISVFNLFPPLFLFFFPVNYIHAVNPIHPDRILNPVHPVHPVQTSSSFPTPRLCASAREMLLFAFHSWLFVAIRG